MRISCLLVVMALTGATAVEALSAPIGFRDCASACPEMVLLPGGSFLMGGAPTEEAWSVMEAPRHRVSVRSFAVAKNDVTFEEWSACVTDGGCNSYSINTVDDYLGKEILEFIGITAEPAWPTAK